ncbi:hypothetical protein [Amycolatopsis samaneae]|uniref:DUF3558 domain-containing protein n=1 Tax=Amycolatopsis samaneae TaxID=664691 RepID=A0ABW5GCD5_9PSEU
MDERDLETLFSAAPGEPPPSTFTESDVVAESKRQSARHRSRLAVSTSAVVLVLAGAGIFGIVGNVDFGGPKSASSGIRANSAPVPGQPSAGPARPSGSGEAPNFSSASPQQGGDGDGKTGPRVEGTSGCEQVDRELATALAGELPVPVAADGASPGGACTTGARAAGFPLPDGMISVAVLPAGAPLDEPRQPAGAAILRLPARGGGTLVLVSVAGTAGHPVPFAGELGRIAGDLAARF